MSTVAEQKTITPKLRFKGFDNEWKKFLMNEIATKITDGTHDTPKQISKGVPYLTAIHVKDGKIDFDNCYYLDQKDHDIIYKRCNPELGDLLVVNIGAGTATCASVTVDYEFSLKNVALIKPNRKIVYPDYLSQLQRKNAKKLFLQLTSGGAQPFLSLKEIGRLKVSIPTLQEQQKIASFLSAVDEKIKQLARKKELLEQYKKGVMQQLFSGKLRFKDGNGKAFPKWEVDILDNLTERNICYGVVQPGIEDENGVKFIRGGDIYQASISKNLRVISKEITDKYRRTYLNGGELVMSLVGYPGETAIVPRELRGANLARQVALIDLKKTINTEYVHFYISSDLGKKNLLGKTIGSAQQVINIKTLKEIKIPVPCIEEQVKIATFISSIYKINETLTKQITQTQNFKKGLLQQMFV